MSKKTKDTLRPALPFERQIRELEERIAELEEMSTHMDLSAEIDALRKKLEDCTAETYSNLGPWERVSVARHGDRPVASDYITSMLDEFHELHGDKVFGDDYAMVSGLARIEDRRFMLIGHRKGKTTKERLETNFGCAHPEGYRKALRKMKLAEKLGLPIVTLINTPGAYPGIGAEERGQAAAIAENILGMFSVRVPILVIVIGEGGSGGALGIGIGDRVWMMEYSYYSVISPEGCAAILWKDGNRCADAAEALKLTATDLTGFGLIDGIVKEPQGGAHRDHEKTIASMKQVILSELDELCSLPADELLAARRRKFRFAGSIEGRFPEPAADY